MLSIRAVVTPDGTEYRPDIEKIQSAGDPSRGEGFLYEEFKFDHPSDLAYAADGSNYLFVLDAGADSLFVFNARGIEGVAPPPGGTSRSRSRFFVERRMRRWRGSPGSGGRGRPG